MRLFAGSVEEFSKELKADRLVPALEHSFSKQMLHRPSTSEVTSWANSLPVLAEDLVSAGIDEAGIVIEYMLPLSRQRGSMPSFWGGT